MRVFHFFTSLFSGGNSVIPYIRLLKHPVYGRFVTTQETSSRDGPRPRVRMQMPTDALRQHSAPGRTGAREALGRLRPRDAGDSRIRHNSPRGSTSIVRVC